MKKLFLLASIMLLGGCFSIEDEDKTGTGFLGIDVKEVSMVGVEGAKVILLPDSIVVYSQEHGKCPFFTPLDLGTYGIVVSKEGMIADSDTIYFELTAQNDTIYETVWLEPIYNGSISGKITNVEGSPIARAEVTLYPDKIKTVSDSSGRYSFDSLRHMDYQVACLKGGYNSYKSKSVSVSEGKIIIEHNLQLENAIAPAVNSKWFIKRHVDSTGKEITFTEYTSDIYLEISSEKGIGKLYKNGYWTENYQFKKYPPYIDISPYYIPNDTLKIHFIDSSAITHKDEYAESELIMTFKVRNLSNDLIELELNNETYYFGKHELFTLPDYWKDKAWNFKNVEHKKLSGIAQYERYCGSWDKTEYHFLDSVNFTKTYYGDMGDYRISYGKYSVLKDGSEIRFSNDSILHNTGDWYPYKEYTYIDTTITEKEIGLLEKDNLSILKVGEMYFNLLSL